MNPWCSKAKLLLRDSINVHNLWGIKLSCFVFLDLSAIDYPSGILSHHLACRCNTAHLILNLTELLPEMAHAENILLLVFVHRKWIYYILAAFGIPPNSPWGHQYQIKMMSTTWVLFSTMGT